MERSVNQKSPLIIENGFDKSVKPYFNQLKKYCLSLTNSKWDGEDLFQDTLMKAFKKWDQQPRDISKAYLFRIASNTWIDNHRKHAPEIDAYADLLTIPGDKSMDKAAIEEAMSILLKKLTPKQRVVLLLTEAFNYTHQEIAEMIDCKEGAVRAALHRARKKLKFIDDKDAWDFECQEDARTYAQVFYSGAPEGFAKLYREETTVMGSRTKTMGSLEKTSLSTILIKNVAGTHASYCLVPIPMANGETMYMPFYQTEINALLAWLEENDAHPNAA
ncbi:RNA polymerase sigma factor (sigma-70 family) [Scopulibacillus darangshiensis]|uniref:RNA polymerase sigma factor (Sigma-70 family) n=1 Tax=Scopulibacillus darangshiensis TaxID=442528 RepID=A0A4R2PAK7_9BACL|nr:RNA polymerase sigma factor [Scopulibacillus darangshiensis]TCP31314.1 RNA polymerase sigma factor (sigma-70 family) [Scopulibacillus darangshiensis]